jgi:serine protease Do
MAMARRGGLGIFTLLILKGENRMSKEPKVSAGRGRAGRALTALALAVGIGAGGLALHGAATPVKAQLSERGAARAPFSFADVVDKVRPAVVSIYVTGKIGKRSRRNRFRGKPFLPEGHPLNKFFKKFEKEFGARPNRPVRAQGSGFIISPDGYVVTNHHVIRNADRIKVALDGGKRLDARLIGSDQRTDIALLKIKKPGTYASVRLATREVRVGDWVLAVGNPFGLSSTVTAGIVSARGRDVGDSPYDFIQIDAAVNKGNSGGPTFNLDGEVVGVNTSIISPSGGNVGIAFAVPADIVRDVVAQLKKNGSVSRGWLGVQIQSVSEDMAASLGLEEAHGAIVGKLTRNSPALKAGLQVGDLILEVNGEKVKASRDLARKIAALAPKSKTDLTIFRDGHEQNVQVKLGRFPGSKKISSMDSDDSESVELDELGLSLAPAADFSRGGKNSEGVYVTDVDAKSVAADKGLRRGDIILDVNGRAVSSPEDVAEAIKKARKKGRRAILVRFRSRKREAFVALPINKRG